MKWDYNRLGRPDVVYMELEGVEKKEDRGPTKKEQQESKLGEALVELGYRLEKGMILTRIMVRLWNFIH